MTTEYRSEKITSQTNLQIAETTNKKFLVENQGILKRHRKTKVKVTSNENGIIQTERRSKLSLKESKR